MLNTNATGTFFVRYCIKVLFTFTCHNEALLCKTLEANWGEHQTSVVKDVRLNVDKIIDNVQNLYGRITI